MCTVTISLVILLFLLTEKVLSTCNVGRCIPYITILFFAIALYRNWQHELDRRQRGRTPRLWVAIVKLFWLKLVAQFILCAIEVCFRRHFTFDHSASLNISALPRDLAFVSVFPNMYVLNELIVMAILTVQMCSTPVEVSMVEWCDFLLWNRRIGSRGQWEPMKGHAHCSTDIARIHT